MNHFGIRQFFLDRQIQCGVAFLSGKFRRPARGLDHRMDQAEHHLQVKPEGQPAHGDIGVADDCGSRHEPVISIGHHQRAAIAAC